MAGLEGIYRMVKLTRIVALSWKVRAWVSMSEKCPFGCFYPFQSSAEGRSSSELRTFRTAWGGGMGVRDFGGLERGRSPLWIPNHPRFHGSAWKVTALNIEPSTISRFSVESHRSGYRTIHDLMVQRGKSPLWKPSQSGRSEPTAELAQPALSSRRAYIPAAVTPNRPCSHFVAAQYIQRIPDTVPRIVVVR